MINYLAPFKAKLIARPGPHVTALLAVKNIELFKNHKK
jgi:hypothetical protein